MGSEAKVVPVVCGILCRGDTVLIARRPLDKLLGGLWEFPGGKIELGESPEAALHRELMEELACAIVIDRALPSFEHAYEWCIVDLHPFMAHLCEDSPPPTAIEHLELRWVTLQELLGLADHMAPADLPLLAEVSRRLP